MITLVTDNAHIIDITLTAWKVSKHGVTSGPYFSVFGPNTGKYGPEITPYLDTFHAVYYQSSNPYYWYYSY